MTLQDIFCDRSLLAGYKGRDLVPLGCSCCGVPLQKTKEAVQKALRAGYEGSYCSRRCQGLHIRKRATSVQDGVEGRHCSECGEWTPLPKMTARGRGRVCMLCKRKKPRQMFSILRSKARYRGLSWGLSYKDLMGFWGRSCFYCETEIETVGLDRLDSSEGYKRDNLVPCCGACNRGKGDQSREDFLDRCRRVADRASVLV